jgi:putative FmdB family regulatory protein
MPTYEYRCKSCGEHLEAVQSFTDDPLTTCPSCEGELKKVFGSIGISFKGSGFYKTDSRGGSKTSSGSGGDGSSSETKSDTKSDSKSETKSDGAAPAKSDGAAPAKKETKTESKPAKSA